mmetsp:Transcript_18705/g.61405  ORF Transcript_18705/g.61405 Transcript_18705/m.61405 type:complete len:204 (+) Transcript_18705:540-1151(+)
MSSSVKLSARKPLGMRKSFPLTSTACPMKANKAASRSSLTESLKPFTAFTMSSSPKFTSNSTSHPSSIRADSSFEPSMMALGRSLICVCWYFLLLMISAFFAPAGVASDKALGITRDRTQVVQRSASISSPCMDLQIPGFSRQRQPSAGRLGSTSLPCLSFHLLRSTHLRWYASSTFLVVCRMFSCVIIDVSRLSRAAVHLPA